MIVALQQSFYPWQKEYYALEACIMKHTIDIRQNQTPVQIFKEMLVNENREEHLEQDKKKEIREIIRFCIHEMEGL